MIRIREDAGVEGKGFEIIDPVFGPGFQMMESSILAQNERWRRVLSMQVERQ